MGGGKRGGSGEGKTIPQGEGGSRSVQDPTLGESHSHSFSPRATLPSHPLFPVLTLFVSSLGIPRLLLHDTRYERSNGSVSATKPDNKKHRLDIPPVRCSPPSYPSQATRDSSPPVSRRWRIYTSGYDLLRPEVPHQPYPNPLSQQTKPNLTHHHGLYRCLEIGLSKWKGDPRTSTSSMDHIYRTIHQSGSREGVIYLLQIYRVPLPSPAARLSFLSTTKITEGERQKRNRKKMKE
ncbi:hypothetical protein BP00DRAFT_165769 [Aspergillus indologenus CBS 114.80]|uniref:Uncharacterized protein n=1 Tax=Aspergillus indologenus CBS 114.80 TaxID=1450541 RepID=A0A2V5I538_9EURO|nr:hypothetical protein BP00DRAFT_165769 [Aspergillus indologenus CBS 114.80]